MVLDYHSVSFDQANVTSHSLRTLARQAAASLLCKWLWYAYRSPISIVICLIWHCRRMCAKSHWKASRADTVVHSLRANGPRRRSAPSIVKLHICGWWVDWKLPGYISDVSTLLYNWNRPFHPSSVTLASTSLRFSSSGIFPFFFFWWKFIAWRD